MTDSVTQIVVTGASTSVVATVDGTEVLGTVEDPYVHVAVLGGSLQMSGPELVSALNAQLGSTTWQQGAAGSANFTHVQPTASTTWTVTHNLGFAPSINVHDDDGNLVVARYTHTGPDFDVSTVLFDFATTGVAYCS